MISKRILVALILGIVSFISAAAQVDNCCFVDRQCNNAQDWENGYWAFQNGQCAASAPAQPQSPAQPASSIPAAVDNCCQVDRQCHTATDWENGYWAFQNGQCAASAPAQPQSPAQPASSIPAAVDNCCQVDRQCHTAADWENGYWAFQNGQCAAPAQPASDIPAGVDNCCQVDRECQSEWDWEQGFYAYLAGQCRVAGAPRGAAWSPYMTEPVYRLLQNPSSDPFNNCCYMYQDCRNSDDWNRGSKRYREQYCRHPAPLGVRPAIVGNSSPLGTAKFNKLVNSALELMRVHTPEWLRYIDLSGALEFRLRESGVDAGFYNQDWSIAHSFYSWEQEDPNWEPDFDYIVGYAGGITHEACHAIQQRTNSHSTGWTNEVACEEAQLAVIEAINPNSHDIGWLRDSIANYQNES